MDQSAWAQQAIRRKISVTVNSRTSHKINDWERRGIENNRSSKDAFINLIYNSLFSSIYILTHLVDQTCGSFSPKRFKNWIITYPIPYWALPANLYRSAQILTDIPGLFENWIVINSVFEKEISWLKSALRKKNTPLIWSFKKSFCANLYRSVQILADNPGFVIKN